MYRLHKKGYTVQQTATVNWNVAFLNDPSQGSDFSVMMVADKAVSNSSFTDENGFAMFKYAPPGKMLMPQNRELTPCIPGK